MIKKVKEVVISYIIPMMLIFSILSFLYISRPAIDYISSNSEKHFNSISDFQKVHLEYIGKVIDVKGIVKNLDVEGDFTNITLDSFFLFSVETINLTKEIKTNDELVIKGRYEGYDDLFDEYSFTDCSVK
ncbi:MAG: hypothetical protein P8H17_02325 [Flavobacteriales bacterium]|nr:hypothetical protein [Flavobacteriales bacterium]|tara:strand:+ start:242 stop:631 length:390 start_codon:yes stop_codon:yes gene_type:complete